MSHAYRDTMAEKLPPLQPWHPLVRALCAWLRAWSSFGNYGVARVDRDGRYPYAVTGFGVAMCFLTARELLRLDARLAAIPGEVSEQLWPYEKPVTFRAEDGRYAFSTYYYELPPLRAAVRATCLRDGLGVEASS